MLPSVCLTNFFQAKIFLGLGDPLEKGMAIHSSVLAWRIPGTEKPGGLQSLCHKELDTTEQLMQCKSTTLWASLVAQLAKNLPTLQETLVWFLGWEDMLEKG